jgi:hypothetical protein
MDTYAIVRGYFNDAEYPSEVIATGLSLDEAKEHCSNPETSSSTATSEAAVALTEERGPWFDGFEAE